MTTQTQAQQPIQAEAQSGDTLHPQTEPSRTDELKTHTVKLQVQTENGIKPITRRVKAVNSEHAQVMGMDIADHYMRNHRNVNAVYSVKTWESEDAEDFGYEVNE